MFIYHLVEKEQWEKSKIGNEYSPSSLKKDGFIYCSTKDQVLPSASRFYPNSSTLLLLVIDSEKISSSIIFEDLHNKGVKHPHIYGSLPIDSVKKIIPLQPDKNGNFKKLPEGI